jgi:hypothetical protein
MVATNSIGQGDTREGGLATIVRQGGRISFAHRYIKWPGVANVEVNLVAISRKMFSGDSQLDGSLVNFISSRLNSEPEEEPKRLRVNQRQCFIGSYVRGSGFILDTTTADALISRSPRNRDCLFQYLDGEDVNGRPDQTPSRWVIDFFDWSISKAKQYPELLAIVEERVKPERHKLAPVSSDYRKLREFWWQFARSAIEMHNAIAPLERVLVRAQTSDTHALCFVPRGYVYSLMTVVFAFDDYCHFALLQSSVHEAWVRQNASTMRTDLRYTPTDCFETYPFPQLSDSSSREWAEQIGEQYHEYRRQIMLDRSLGLTKVYNLYHNNECRDSDIMKLRELHAELDLATFACYGWKDLNSSYAFHQNGRGKIRYTVDPEIQLEILRRLLALNLDIAALETTADKPVSGSATQLWQSGSVKQGSV